MRRIVLHVCLLWHFSVVSLRELILLWSKLQRRIDVSLESFLERCLQFGAIAKNIYHLLFLIRVIQTEVNRLISSIYFMGLAVFDTYFFVFSDNAPWPRSIS